MSMKAKFVSLAELKKSMGREADPESSRQGLVYSTEHGRLCPDCGKTKKDCICQRAVAPAGDGRVRVGRETKGRNGKVVTLVSGLPLAGKELNALAKKLKQLCGVGGAVNQNIVEIEGDHRELFVKELIAFGYDAKKSGG